MKILENGTLGLYIIGNQLHVFYCNFPILPQHCPTFTLPGHKWGKCGISNY